MKPMTLSNQGELYVFSIIYRSFPGVETPFISAVVDLEGGGTVKGTLKNIAADPDQIQLGMPVEVIYEIAPRKDREGNEYMTFYFQPRKQAREHDNVYIVGIDMIKFGKFPDRSVESLGAEAALGALDDAGLTIRDMEALYCGNLMFASGMVGQRILREIGLTGIPVVNCANACATGATAFREGWIAIKAGLYDLVLAVGVEKMAGAGLLGGPRESGIPTEGLLGSGTMPCVFAEAGLEHSPQVRHHLRAVRQGGGQEPPPRHHEPEGALPDGDAARRGDVGGDDLVPQHQADVQRQRRRLGGGGDRLREDGAASSAEARGQGAPPRS